MDYEEEMMIRTEHLSKSYGEKEAVCDLTLEIRRGEIFGLLGPNGAGKTTTTLMLLGLTEPTGGSAYIDGKDCARQASSSILPQAMSLPSTNSPTRSQIC